MARVECFGDGDRVNVFAGELRVSTWMGYYEYTNVDGKTSYKWRGGSDQLTQTGAGEERYTIGLDVGDSGNGIRLEMTNREGQALFRLHVDPTGRGDIFFARGLSQTHGDSPQAVHATTHHGNQAHEVTGNHTHTVGGVSVHTASNGWRLNSGAIAEIIAAGAMNFTAVDDLSVQTAGEMLLSAANQLRVVGDGLLFEPLTGGFEIKTLLPDAVKLGEGATSHAVKYEELLPVLQTILSSLNTLRGVVANMTLPVSGPTAGPNPAYTAYSAPINVDLTTIRTVVTQIK
jgi:hypothetical protein